MDYHIRTATQDDAPSIIAMLNPIIAAGCYTTMTEPLTVESQRQWMRSVANVGVINLAIAGDRVLGIQSVEPHSRKLQVVKHVCDISTFVALDAHRQGIGRTLAADTFAGARRLGYSKIVAMIRADNPGAVQFYQRIGFSVAGTLRQHMRVRDQFVDEVLAERFLD